MKVKAIVGRGKFHGTPKEIVLNMTRGDYVCHGKEHYMEEVKLRIELVYDKKITLKKGRRKFMHFLMELERIKFIEIERRS